jgi:hypothetical protein
MALQLQGIGKVPAKPAKDFKPGEKTMWNFGFIETVLSVEFSKTGKTVKWVIDSNGKEYTRKLGANRLVGMA